MHTVFPSGNLKIGCNMRYLNRSKDNIEKGRQRNSVSSLVGRNGGLS
jgi:hypothetical protein